MISVLFVCWGNICRSPMAEAVFQHMVNRAGLKEHFLIDSAGIDSWHVGESAHRGTLTLLRENHIPYNGRCRQITQADLRTFDYVFVADDDVMQALDLKTKSDHTEVTLFLTDAFKLGVVDTDEVPDPYYDSTFPRTYKLTIAGCNAILARLRQTHNL